MERQDPRISSWERSTALGKAVTGC